MTAAISPDTLGEAYALTRRTTLRTPLIECPALAARTGAARLFVKAENLQKAGSFKIRGATWRLSRLTPEERARGVVAFSSGNFAQGLAAAGQAAGVAVTIVMPEDAPEVKRRATEAFGARVILTAHGSAPRELVAAERARAIAAEEGLTLLHPFDDPAVIAGQAGVAIEALEQMAEAGATPDLVAAPTGGGGLLAGVALVMRDRLPGTQVYSVEPVGFDGMRRSLSKGDVTRVPDGGRSLCDALQAPAPGVHTFAAAHAAGVRAVAVTDDEVRPALAAAFENLKVVVEPAGSAALAAVLAGHLPVSGRTVLVILSGGNIALRDFMALTAPTLT